MDLLTGRTGSESDRSGTSDGGATSWRRTLRRLALATGIVAAVAYLASRRAGSGETGSAVDEVRETAADALPEGPADTLPGIARTIPIGETDSGPASDESLDESTGRPAVGEPDFEHAVGAGEEDTDEATGETVDDTSAGERDDRSDEELAEMADEDVDEAPAEPGEMTVDEDLVDDLVTDESSDEPDEEPADEVEDDS